MKSIHRRLTIAILLVCVPLAGRLAAQIFTGSCSGTVQDSSRMVVPGAEVTIVHVATGFARKSETDDSGGFYFGGLDGGEYTIKVSKAGFKTAEERSVMLATGDRLRIPAITLELGTVSEVVSVTAQAGAIVQTEGGERADVITSDQVENLLVLGRNINALVRLVPGVVDESTEDSISRNQQFNVMGNNKRSNNISVDGVVSTESDSGMGSRFTVGQDAVAEVRILVSNYQAEYGRAAGSNMVIVTKSGSRQFHGLASYFKRHEQFNAGNFFDNRDGRAKPRYRYNTWTYNLGGPVYIPGKFNRGRDKLFFFWQQEFWPSRVGTIGRRTMPTALEREGDFSQTVDLNNRLITIRDPMNNNTPFSGNQIPKARVDPSGQALLKNFAVPNFFDRTVSAGQYNYVFMQEQNLPRRAETLKLDYNINPRNTLTGTLNDYRETAIGSGVTGTNANWPQMSATYAAPGTAANGRYTRILSPRMINEFLFAWMYSPASHQYTDEELRRNQRDGIGFTAGQLYPAANPLKLVPNATFGGVTNAPTYSMDGRFPFDFMLHTLTWDDRVTLIHDAHTVKAGVYVERSYRDMRIQGSLFNGSIDFQNNANNPLNTGYAFANAALGAFYSYSEDSANPRMHARGSAIESFIQDNWKIHRRLTLDYGLRTYWTPLIHERDNVMAGFVPARFDPAKQPLLIQPVMDAGKRVGIDPRTRTLYPAAAIGAIAPGSGDPFNGMVAANQTTNYPQALADDPGLVLGPRFGFAYDVTGNGRTALRGGFGMFYNREVMANTFKWMIAQPPVVVSPIIQYGQLSQLASYSGLYFPSDVLGRERAYRLPTVMNFNLSVQRNVGYGTIVDVGYSGALGRHLYWRRNINPVPAGANFLARNADATQPGKPLAPAFLRPMIGYGDINMMEENGTSNYNSLQVTARRRFARGFQFGLAWTWSKALDFVDEDSGNAAASAVSALVSPRVWNYGLASFDRTHVVAINYLYDLPKTRWSFAPGRTILNGWQLSGITRFMSGAPTAVGYTLVSGADISGTTSQAARIVVTGNPVLPKDERDFNHNFRTNVFQAPAPGTFGNAAKYILRGPGINNWDLSVFRNFRVRERLNTQFRCEMYNAFNHTQFSTMNTTARFDAAGNQINQSLSQFTAARRPRYIQLALRMTF